MFGSENSLACKAVFPRSEITAIEAALSQGLVSMLTMRDGLNDCSNACGEDGCIPDSQVMDGEMHHQISIYGEVLMRQQEALPRREPGRERPDDHFSALVHRAAEVEMYVQQMVRELDAADNLAGMSELAGNVLLRSGIGTNMSAGAYNTQAARLASSPSWTPFPGTFVIRLYSKRRVRRIWKVQRGGQQSSVNNT